VLTLGRCEQVVALKYIHKSGKTEKDLKNLRQEIDIQVHPGDNQGQILSQSPTDATRFWWHLYGS